MALKGLGGFTLGGAARRAGVDEHSIRQVWANSSELLAAALVEFGMRNLPLPDKGSFHGDLLAYAKSWARMADTPLGRRLIDAVIARPVDWDLSASRPALLEKRDVRMSAIVTRAIQRGDCNPGTDPARLVDLIALGVCLPILLYDREITDADCELVVDTVVNGVRPR